MSESPRSHRRTVVFVTLAALVVPLGLATRSYPHVLPESLGKYPGDALWALVVFLVTAAVMRASSTTRTAAVALAIAFVVEFGQIYHAPWIDSVRDTTLGRLVLGAHFDAMDLLAYTVGVLVGVALDRMRPCARLKGVS